MSIATETRAGVETPSLASSAAFKTFALVFGLATPVIYVVCEMQNWPLFTYHPGTNRVNLFWAAAVRDRDGEIQVASAPKPEKTGIGTAPSFIAASIATTTSGIIGR